MKTLDQHEVEFKVMTNETTFERKKKSRTCLSLGGILSGLFILAGKITTGFDQGVTSVISVTLDLVTVCIIWILIDSNSEDEFMSPLTTTKQSKVGQINQ